MPSRLGAWSELDEALATRIRSAIGTTADLVVLYGAALQYEFVTRSHSSSAAFIRLAADVSRFKGAGY
jgi:hypothetical protein